MDETTTFDLNANETNGAVAPYESEGAPAQNQSDAAINRRWAYYVSLDRESDAALDPMLAGSIPRAEFDLIVKRKQWAFEEIPLADMVSPSVAAMKARVLFDRDDRDPIERAAMRQIVRYLERQAGLSPYSFPSDEPLDPVEAAA
jgi:hypothetical protein